MISSYDLITLCIKIGVNKPKNKTDCDFYLDSYNFEIDREEIFNKMNKNGLKTIESNSIKNIYLIICIIQKKIEDIEIFYSFKVTLEKFNKINRFEISENKKGRCKPEPVESKNFRCLFMIQNKNSYNYTNLILYANSESVNSTTYINWKYINYELYNSYNETLLKKLLTDNNNSNFTEIDYIVINSSEKNQTLFISVISDSPNYINLYSSYKDYEDYNNYYLIPNSLELISIKNDINYI